MPSAADPRWERLTLSAKAAWRWAWATATARAGPAEPSGELVDTVDLLAGLALAQLRDNPVSQLFTHFHVTTGSSVCCGSSVLNAVRRSPAWSARQSTNDWNARAPAR